MLRNEIADSITIHLSVGYVYLGLMSLIADRYLFISIAANWTKQMITRLSNCFQSQISSIHEFSDLYALFLPLTELGSNSFKIWH